MATVYFGLGSNLGPRWVHLSQAVGELSALDSELAISPVYESAPVGGPDGQGAYLNCVVRVISDRGAHELLEFAQQLEKTAHRVRIERWGPRTLDVDVLLIDDQRIDEPDLVVPHPRMYGRAFVLAPLEDLAPELVPDDWRAALGGVDKVAGEIRRVGELLRSPDESEPSAR